MLIVNKRSHLRNLRTLVLKPRLGQNETPASHHTPGRVQAEQTRWAATLCVTLCIHVLILVDVCNMSGYLHRLRYLFYIYICTHYCILIVYIYSYCIFIVYYITHHCLFVVNLIKHGCLMCYASISVFLRVPSIASFQERAKSSLWYQIWWTNDRIDWSASLAWWISKLVLPSKKSCCKRWPKNPWNCRLQALQRFKSDTMSHTFIHLK